MPEPVLLGIPSSVWAGPLERRLAQQGGALVASDAPALVARDLREGKLAAALLAPSDYARDSSAYQILPACGVTAAGPYGPVRLHARRGVRAITRLAVDPSSSAEIILARILLAEEFDSSPQIVPHPGPLAAMLEVAEAALVLDAGGKDADTGSQVSLDLVEVWQELTELPFVYGIWCAYERALPEADARRIQAAHRDAEVEAEHLRAATPDEPAAAFVYSGQTLLEESMREFLHYAYYHGILPDVPELEYYRFGAADRSV